MVTPHSALSQREEIRLGSTREFVYLTLSPFALLGLSVILHQLVQISLSHKLRLLLLLLSPIQICDLGPEEQRKER